MNFKFQISDFKTNSDCVRTGQPPLDLNPEA